MYKLDPGVVYLRSFKQSLDRDRLAGGSARSSSDDVESMQRKNMAAVVNYCCFAGTAQLPALPLARAGQVVLAATLPEQNDGRRQVMGSDVTGEGRREGTGLGKKSGRELKAGQVSLAGRETQVR